MISDTQYTNRRIHFTGGNAWFLWYFSVYHIPFVHSILERSRKFIMRPNLWVALRVASRPSVCPSVPCLRFSRNRNVI